MELGTRKVRIGFAGVGGMGAVHQGFKPGSNEKVAIKIMLAGLSNDASPRQRFDREIEMMRALNHPHIVPLYAHGEENGVPITNEMIVQFCRDRSKGTNTKINTIACQGELLELREMEQSWVKALRQIADDQIFYVR